MQNLLLAASAADRFKKELSDHDGLQILALYPDGSLTCDGQPVSTETHPVHLAWLSSEVITDGVIKAFSKVLKEATELKWFQTITAGLDHPMFQGLLERGVRLCNSDAQAPAIAEYVIGAVLYHYQKFPDRVTEQSNRNWQPVPFRQLYNTNWLIVGFGNIGQRVGKMARGFEAEVTGVKRRPGKSPDADRIITFDELDAGIPKADVVVIACALTEQTKELVDEAFLSKLKSSCVLVNIARGDIVDESALLAKLDADCLDYAVLDVFREEPLPAESPFWAHDRVHVTPHASNQGNATGPRAVELFLTNLDAYLKGQPLRNEVDQRFFEN